MRCVGLQKAPRIVIQRLLIKPHALMKPLWDIHIKCTHDLFLEMGGGGQSPSVLEAGNPATLLLRRVASLGDGRAFFLLLSMTGKGNKPPGVLDSLEMNSSAGVRG